MESIPLGRTIRFREACWFWLQLGCISFGGPAAQLSLLHRELVERRRWLSERRFLHALNYAMVLPGPEAQQLSTYIGWLMHGTAGGLVAGSLFILPSLLLLIGLATIYALWGQVPLLAAVFWALKPAVTAIVIQAAWKLSQRALPNGVLVTIALAAFGGLTLFKLPFPALIASAAGIGWLGGRFWPNRFRPGQGRKPGPSRQDVPSQSDVIHGDDTPSPAHARLNRRSMALTLLAGGLGLGLPLALVSLLNGWDGVLATMARFFSRVALVTFGGAYAVLPYVTDQAVNHFHWLSASQMIDGLALGETTPGPLIMVVTFVGFMGGWSGSVFGSSHNWLAAVAAAGTVTWFTFLPSFLFILAGGPLVEASREDIRLVGPLTAITAAVVGVIANLALFFAVHVLWPETNPELTSGVRAAAFDGPALVVMLAASWALLRWHWSVIQVIGAAALVGLVKLGTQQLL
jgi:chromate transporter